MSTKDAYSDTKLNVKIFGESDAPELSDYFRSTTYFFDERYVGNKFSMLDVGGSSGDFIRAIQSAGFEIDGYVLDPDENSIHLGKKKYPGYKFQLGYFPSEDVGDKSVDLVSMQALFPQLPSWKEVLLDMARVARKYINFSLIFRLDGPTVIDLDTSYFYYLDSGRRVHQIVHNIYEFVNFLCIHEMRAKKIRFMGYHTPYAGHNFRCLPNSEQIKGNVFVELFTPEESYPVRMGGAVDKGVGISDYSFFKPDIEIEIDGKAFLLN